MKFVLKPSLQHIALVKVTILLWNQNDVRTLLSKLGSGYLYSSEKFKVIEERVINKVPQLLLPQTLKEKVLGFIKPIGLEIKGWVEFHCTRFSLHVPLPSELLWAPQGTVDRKRTAEVLVRDENLDISTRYRLACIYCLESDILKMWNSMPEELKKSVSDKFPIVIFWSDIMKRSGLGYAHLSYVDYRSQFEQCARLGNKVAAEYFLQKLTPLEKEKTLVETAKHVRDAEVFCFLLSEINEEKQIEVFKNSSYDVLLSFLQWPFQSFFIGIANRMWDFLFIKHYHFLFSAIIWKVKVGFKDWNYQKLFREFWQDSPNVLKSLFMEDKSSLLFFFRTKDKESIRLILKDATLTVKENLIYSDEIDYYLLHSINENEWDFLGFFLRECLPSKNEMLNFKEKIEKRMSYYFKQCSATKKQKWNELFFFSDDSICKNGKRSVEEGESSSSKQFRSLE